MTESIFMKEGEEVVYKSRKIYLNMLGEYCCIHLWGGMISFNSSFDTIEKAMLFIDTVTGRRDLLKEDFERIAYKIKKCITVDDEKKIDIY